MPNNTSPIPTALPRKRFASTLVLLVQVFTATSGLAAGTREIFSDLGLFAGDSEGAAQCRMDIYTWSAQSITIDAQASSTSGTPEGQRTLNATVSRDWGGYGFFHVSQFDLSVVETYDYSAYAGGDIRFWLRSANPLNVEVEFATAAGAARKSGVVVASTGNAWKEIVLPISGFSPAIDLSRIRGPFLITATQSGGAKQWQLDHLRYCKPLARLEIFPKSAYAPPGSRLQFTVEGRTASGDTVLVYPVFTTEGTLALREPVAPLLGLAGIFEATPTPTSALVTARVAGADPTIQPAQAPVYFSTRERLTQAGLYSETAPSLIQLDTNAKLLSFSGGSAAEVLIETSTTQFSEGAKSLVTTVDNADGTGFSGWTIAVGKEDAPDTETKDMSAFYDGSLRFSLKAPVSLATNIFVGIRSGNVPAGQELSRVPAADYTSIDNQWHDVVIPISVFAKAKPWADLSRIKNLFTISVIGATDGPQQLFVDDVQWEGRVAALHLSSASMGPDGKTFRIRVEGPPDAIYAIEASEDLVAWHDVESATLGGSPVELVHTNTLGQPFSFFRVKKP